MAKARRTSELEAPVDRGTLLVSLLALVFAGLVAAVIAWHVADQGGLNAGSRAGHPAAAAGKA